MSPAHSGRRYEDDEPRQIVEHITHSGWGVPQIANAIIGCIASIAGSVAVALLLQSMHEKQSQHDTLLTLQGQIGAVTTQMSGIQSQLSNYANFSTKLATLEVQLANAEKVIDSQQKRIQDLEAMRRLK